MNCPLCETHLLNRKDSVYFECSICFALVRDEVHYLSPEKEKERYIKHNNNIHYPNYQAFTAPIAEEIRKHHTTDQLGLDYGCGSGPVISKMLGDQGFQIQLYDPFFYPDPEYLKNRYHYIFSCEVFEHFLRPADEIQKLIGLLLPRGRIIIMTHLYEPHIPFRTWYYRNDPTHVFIYTPETISFITATYGLELEHRTNRIVVWKKL